MSHNIIVGQLEIRLSVLLQFIIYNLDIIKTQTRIVKGKHFIIKNIVDKKKHSRRNTQKLPKYKVRKCHLGYRLTIFEKMHDGVPVL